MTEQSNNRQNIRKIVRIEVLEGKGSVARQALYELELATRLEEDCIEFSFFQALDRETSFLLVENFSSKQALDSHMLLPHTQYFFSLGIINQIQAFPEAWTQ